ncbi:hypothetical protein RRG08_022103 [Elysia crispata]|uniref:Ig-like domain-containing protein n=1 Tax=Elysia crispata TaxID=231223 RepID=A0AAE1CQZ2_9GAST|nr:hypothetical protein RRG08_022103 [Elysia crispata]
MCDFYWSIVVLVLDLVIDTSPAGTSQAANTCAKKKWPTPSMEVFIQNDRMTLNCTGRNNPQNHLTWIAAAEVRETHRYFVTFREGIYVRIVTGPQVPGIEVSKISQTPVVCGNEVLSTMEVELRRFEGYSFTCYGVKMTKIGYEDLNKPDERRSEIYRHPVFGETQLRPASPECDFKLLDGDI